MCRGNSRISWPCLYIYTCIGLGPATWTSSWVKLIIYIVMIHINGHNLTVSSPFYGHNFLTFEVFCPVWYIFWILFYPPTLNTISGYFSHLHLERRHLSTCQYNEKLFKQKRKGGACRWSIGNWSLMFYKDFLSN